MIHPVQNSAAPVPASNTTVETGVRAACAADTKWKKAPVQDWIVNNDSLFLEIEIKRSDSEKFILIEGVDSLQDDEVFMSLAKRPDVLSVLRSQRDRLNA